MDLVRYSGRIRAVDGVPELSHVGGHWNDDNCHGPVFCPHSLLGRPSERHLTSRADVKHLRIAAREKPSPDFRGFEPRASGTCASRLHWVVGLPVFRVDPVEYGIEQIAIGKLIRLFKDEGPTQMPVVGKLGLHRDGSGVFVRPPVQPVEGIRCLG